MAKKKKPKIEKIEVNMDSVTAAMLEIMQENMYNFAKNLDDRITWYFIFLINAIIFIVNILIVIFFYR